MNWAFILEISDWCHRHNHSSTTSSNTESASPKYEYARFPQNSSGRDIIRSVEITRNGFSPRPSLKSSAWSLAYVKIKVFAVYSEAHDWLAWIYQTIIKWIFKQWFTRVVCNILYFLFAFSDIVSGSVHLSRRAKFTARRCVERGRRLPYLCCVYTTMYASCVIQVTRAGIVDMSIIWQVPAGIYFTIFS